MSVDVQKISGLLEVGAVRERRVEPWKQNQRQGGEKAGIRDQVSLSYEARQKQTGNKNKEDLSPEEKQQVNELQKRDAEVKAHEQAHMAAGGGLVSGGASYQYEVGPDGKRYAVGGEVSIDVSPERTPEATIRKMQQVKRAAMAPAQPSGTDRAVAARAAQAEAKARAEKTQEAQNTVQGENAGDPPEADRARAMGPMTPQTPVDEIPGAGISRSDGESGQGQTGRRIDLFG
ncbi:MAG: putative metalloprotease CJM1_0395 family protein [Desulfosarcinaceae bacterium]